MVYSPFLDRMAVFLQLEELVCEKEIDTMGKQKETGKRELLDCTLRDGGYVNDWNFGHETIGEVFERLVSSGVEYIEIGFLDERRELDLDRTIFPDTQSANQIFSGLSKGNAKVLAMIDYGTCSIEHLQPASETFIDGIRVIFKEHLVDEALAFCAEVKKLGYLVFAQLVSVTTYTDEALSAYAAKCNQVHPYATSMVDTYGLLDQAHLLHIAGILDSHLLPDVKLGFHAHNNLQLGFANAKAFLAMDTPRDLLADGTLYGMGKSAGNAPLELLFMWRNEKQGASYQLAQALEAIEHDILPIYQKQYWGYNLLFYLSAEAKCHPNYVRYLMEQKTLSVKQIETILEGLVPEKKLLFDAAYIEQRYLDYQAVSCDETEALQRLKEALAGQVILVLGPGRSAKRQHRKIAQFIEEKRPLVIAVNYAPQNDHVDYIFLTKARRYRELMNDLRGNVNEKAAIIATSNVTRTDGTFSYVLNYASLIDPQTEIMDNSLVMLMKAMRKIGVGKLYLAGFDGYSRRTDNYFDTRREYSFVKAQASYLNRYVQDVLSSMQDELDVEFVTQSRYRTPKGKDSHGK